MALITLKVESVGVIAFFRRGPQVPCPAGTGLAWMKRHGRATLWPDPGHPGVVVVLVGLLVWTGAFAWFGRLPGDLRIERENLRVFIPFGSMLLITLILNLARRLF